MKITEVKTLEEGTAGFTVQAKVLNAWEINTYDGKFGPFKKQNLQLVDGEEKIFTRISNGFISKSDIGKDIQIAGCIRSVYKGEAQIEANDNSVVTIKRTTAKAKKEAITPPKAFLDIVTEALEESQLILEHPKLIDVIKIGVERGFKVEDIRALVIHRLIGK